MFQAKWRGGIIWLGRAIAHGRALWGKVAAERAEGGQPPTRLFPEGKDHVPPGGVWAKMKGRPGGSVSEPERGRADFLGGGPMGQIGGRSKAALARGGGAGQGGW